MLRSLWYPKFDSSEDRLYLMNALDVIEKSMLYFVLKNEQMSFLCRVKIATVYFVRDSSLLFNLHMNVLE
jgi:hypothetical protein